jgi:hypothetical protein
MLRWFLWTIVVKFPEPPKHGLSFQVVGTIPRGFADLDDSCLVCGMSINWCVPWHERVSCTHHRIRPCFEQPN